MFLKCTEEIFNVWFENWLITHVPKLKQPPKWFANERDVKEGDVILFLKNDGALKSTYQFRKIKEIERSQEIGFGKSPSPTETTMNPSIEKHGEVYDI